MMSAKEMFNALGVEVEYLKATYVKEKTTK